VDPRALTADVHYVGAPDWDRRYFDELIPTPEGTSYNSYLIKGSEKTALLDTVDPAKTNVLLDNLKGLKIDRIDYVIAHHAEQDHSGSLPKILEIYKTAKVVTNPKCKEFIKDLDLIPDDRFITINDRETLTLGNKTLEFIYAPWVHWPETMFTYLREDKILFTCDFLGTHLASSELFADPAKIYETNKRYYAEIMMPFRTSIKANLEKIKDLEIKIAAPSHGPVFKDPQYIINAYKEWIADPAKNEVIIPYVSMHGSTAAMVEHLVANLTGRGIVVKPFNLIKTDLGELAMALVDAATVVIGSSTILAGAHPLAFNAANVINMLRPKTKFVSIVGSYGWGGKMVEELAGLLHNLKAETISPVIARGYPKAADLAALDALADQIHKKHQESEAVIK
jgi:flavorubredoxin